MTRNSRSKWANRFWVTNAILLGVWETTAVTTKKVPTISGFCYISRERYGRPTEAAILLWLASLGIHLLKRTGTN